MEFKLANREGENIYSRRARDTVPPYMDNRPTLVAGKPEVAEYKAVFVGGQEVSQFIDEVTVNCAPLV